MSHLREVSYTNFVFPTGNLSDHISQSQSQIHRSQIYTYIAFSVILHISIASRKIFPGKIPTRKIPTHQTPPGKDKKFWYLQNGLEFSHGNLAILIKFWYKTFFQPQVLNIKHLRMIKWSNCNFSIPIMIYWPSFTWKNWSLPFVHLSDMV